MQRLEATEPHFIRCIKPNTQQLANVVDQKLVLQQLKCCGVLEVVRISRAGYPTRYTHSEFSNRYKKFQTFIFQGCSMNCSIDLILPCLEGVSTSAWRRNAQDLYKLKLFFLPSGSFQVMCF